MSKGNDKKPKADKTEPKTGVLACKSAQSPAKPRSARSPKSPGGSRLAREGK
jgi:hypothetical protein